MISHPLPSLTTRRRRKLLPANDEWIVLLFATFLVGFLVFSILLIRLTKMSERRRGVNKEDVMVGDDMRWAEGKVVVQPRVIYERPKGRSGPTGTGGRVWGG